MTLLAPGYLGLLALVPIIILLHMRRRRRLEVASALLWRTVATNQPQRASWQRPPISTALLLQLLTVIAIVWALAGPRLSGHGVGPTVIVIDVGAGMSVLGDDGRTRSESAIATLTSSLDARQAPWSIWRVERRAEPLVLETDDRSVVIAAMSAAKPTDLETDWPAAARTVIPHVADRGRLLVVASNPARARAAFEEIGLPVDVNLDVRGIPGLEPRWFLDHLEVIPNDTRPGRWDVSAVIAASHGDDSDLPTHWVITFRPDGSEIELSLEPEPLAFTTRGTASVDVTVDTLVPGVMTARVVPSDSYAADDALAVRLEAVPVSPRVAVTGPAGPGVANVARAVVAHGATLVGELGTADLVIVAGGEDPGPIGANRLAWLGTASGVADVGALARHDPGVATWNDRHPAAATTAWARLDATAALALPIPPMAETVVAGVAVPLMAALTTAHRREVWLALDPGDARWTESSAFLSAIGDILDWMTPASEQVSWCVVGAPCPVPLAVAMSGGEVRQYGEVVGRWPAGSRALPAAAERSWIPERAGVASWHTGDASGWLAVRVGPAARDEVGAAHITPGEPLQEPKWSIPDVRVAVLVALALVVFEGLLTRTASTPRRGAETSVAGGVVVKRRRLAALGLTLAALALTAALVSAPWPLAWRSRELIVVGQRPADFPWPDRRVRQVSAFDPDGVVDVEAAIAVATAWAASATEPHLLWAAEQAPTRGGVVPSLIRPAMAGQTWTVLAPPTSTLRDAAVLRFEPDRPAFAGDVVTLQAVIHSSHDTRALLRVERDGVEVASTHMTISAGATIAAVPVPTTKAGVELWRIEIRADGDDTPENDSAEALIEVRDAPSVWVVTSEQARGAGLVEALELQGMRAVLRPPWNLPVRMATFAQVDVVVLANVPALGLTTLQQELLATWVRDTGGGLVIAGGEQAFGPGGYMETPLDALSPLSANVPRDAPEVAMVFVLDRSGSMQQQVGGVTRLDIAKQATLTAIELLGPNSQVAVVVFDEFAHVLVPWTTTSDLAGIAAALADLVPGGGTSIYPGLAAAHDLLLESESATRHVVLMTDGLSQPGDFLGITRAIVAADTSVSTVAIGHGTDVELIREIARLGGGAAHVTGDFRALPGILAQEAFMLAGDAVIREPTTPRPSGAGSELLSGMPPTLPPLAGFVETTPKTDAEVVLHDDLGRPLLASWRYGAGRVLAFTSQAIGPWSAAWSATEAFPSWWSRWVRWAVQPTARAGLEIDGRLVGDSFAVVVTARDEHGHELRGLDLEVSWAPDGAAESTQRLVERWDGRYEARVNVLPGRGTLAATDRDGVLQAATLPMVHSFPAVLASPGLDELRALATWTGGSFLQSGPPPLVPSARLQLTLTAHWRPWVVLAAAAWLASLLARYAPSWMPRGRRQDRAAGTRVRSRAGFAKPQAGSTRSEP
jgi:hypothetical protein